MLVLFLAHPDFFTPEERPAITSWINQFKEALKLEGFHVELFDPETHKIQDFKWVHVFSPEEPQGWFWLKQLGISVVVTPSLFKIPPIKSKMLLLSPIGELLGRICRALIQRKWPPMDRKLFFRSADHYFVLQELENPWLARWKIPKNKISYFEKDRIDEAATLAATIYQKLAGSRP